MIDQNSQFFAILTNIGVAKQANADALGIPWKITEMGVGDANGTDPMPDATQTKLINERRRAPLNLLKVDPENAAIIVAEQVIPENVGGWWIREISLYDSDGDMIAIANCAPSFKPLLNQGSGRTQVVRMNMIVSNSSNIELKIDPSVVLATRAYVDSLTKRASQAEAEAGSENSKIMTPLRVFQAIAKVVKQATEKASGWAKIATQAHISAGTDDSTIVTPKKLRAAQATQAEAEAGTDESKLMTPVRVFQAIAKVVVQATENVLGWAKIATQEQVTTGTDDTVIVTPKKLRAAQATQVEAESGTDDTKIMTSLRVFQVLRSAAAMATEALHGVLRIGTQAEVNAGAMDNVIVTPAKMRAGFACSFTTNGYIVFPSWLFGFTLMWGVTLTNAGGVGSTTFPLAFPNACWHVLGTGRSANPSMIGVLAGSGAPTRTGYTWYSSIIGSPGVLGIDWIAVGH
ncbi:phage tail protein [Pseudomonas sp. ES3-33]|uniref:phage tail protein n=1 Tax=Pseudomonas sp. ES3-33 TaxID=1628833 RepID=UPI0005D4336D|nr:phage tail protein [Pseudomonas sp. ES3-33]KJH73917.1 hypothetical protein UB23_27095 [Pseudomonas sp. ES3-33]